MLGLKRFKAPSPLFPFARKLRLILARRGDSENPITVIVVSGEIASVVLLLTAKKPHVSRAPIKTARGERRIRSRFPSMAPLFKTHGRPAFPLRIRLL